VQAVLAFYVLGKEYGYDLKYETGETLRSSTEDAIGYLVGSAIGWAVVLLVRLIS
jgi:hypothetical protein